MKRTRMGKGGLVALTSLAMMAAPVAGQVGVARSLGCDEELVKGDLGINGLDCRGECTVTLNDEGQELFWSFTAEPRIIGVKRGGPADGVLQTGDFLVAIDGTLITTAAGGRRFANVEPGQDVRVRFRRDGRMAEALIHTGESCPAAPPPAPDVAASVVGRVAPPPPQPDQPEPAVAIGVAPKVRRARGVAVDSVVSANVEARGVSVSSSARAPRLEARGVAAAVVPRPRRAGLGINLSCGQCGIQDDPDTGEETWFFSGPFEIIGVDAGGPADRAGIEIGDLIKAIDGHEVQTEAGGRAFSNLAEGEPVSLTVVKRNGREVTVDAVPEVPSTLAITGGVEVGRAAPVSPRADAAVTEPVPPEPRSVVAGVRPPAPPDRAEYPAPVIEAPVGMPLRYTWSQQGVEVEVRGDPVSVMELRGARTLIINTDGLWVRIRIPGGGEVPDAEPIRR